MTWLLCGEDDLIKNWIIDRIDYIHRLDSCVAFGVISNDRIIAGIVYQNYKPEYGTISMSMAAISPMWAKKAVIRRLLEYPFEQLNCYKVMIDVKFDNIKALKTFKKIGFRQEAVLEHIYGKGLHAVILQMLKPDYTQNFGEKKYGAVILRTFDKQETILNHSHRAKQYTITV